MVASSPSPSPKAPPPATAAAAFAPRKSSRVDENAVELTPDGDTWQEKICVCEGAGGKDKKQAPTLVLKSYYRNNRTLQKVWDEPPTGASKVRFATQPDRRKAEAKLKELQQTLNMIPPESSPKSGAQGMGVWLGRFRRNKDKPAAQVHESHDVNLQKAIARSMADHHRGTQRTPASEEGYASKPSSTDADSTNSPTVHFDPDRSSSTNDSPTSSHLDSPRARSTQNPFDDGEDDEEVALAKALSLSVSHSSAVDAASSRRANEIPVESPMVPSSLSEDEMLQLAIRESQREADRRRVSSPSRTAPGRSALQPKPSHLPRHDHRRALEPSSPELVREENASDWDWSLPEWCGGSGNTADDVFDDHGFSGQPDSKPPDQHRRRVTRAKDPPAEPPSRYMEEDDDDAEMEEGGDHQYTNRWTPGRGHRGDLFGRRA
jgi:hypothetical protein